MNHQRHLHAFRDDIMGDLDAVAMAELLRSGAASSAELVGAAIARAQWVNPTINAIEIESFGPARQRAGLGHSGVFAGVPSFVKDNTDLCGLPTRHGSRAVHAQPAKSDNDFARQFLAQGLVVLGKSTMPEFGFNASTEYQAAAPTRNPWHTGYSCGASSGGSAALVAAGVVPIAHANDGGGSIRIPAACCGLIGMKPTRGRLVAARSARSLPVNIVAEGILSRSVRDTAHFYAGSEQYFKNSTLPAIGLVQGPSVRRLKIGVLFDSVTGRPTDDDTRSSIAATAARLEDMGHYVEEMGMPIKAQFASDFSMYWGMLAFFVSAFGKGLVGSGFDAQKLDPLTKGLAAFYKKHAFKTPWVLHRLKKAQHDYAQVFASYDIMLSPVLAHTTPEIGYLSPDLDFDALFERLSGYVSFTPWNNAAGGPAISLPMGVSSHGLPIGAHFCAAHGAERTLLELAFELEQGKPWMRIQDGPFTPRS